MKLVDPNSGPDGILPLTPEEAEAGLATLNELERLWAEIDAKLGHPEIPPTWKTLHELRAERDESLP